MKTMARQTAPRHGAHEHQARRAGAAFRRGDHLVRLQLTSAPAASICGSASRAEPLPSGIRHELEIAFDADLAAVRIHRDDAAHRCTRDVRARAFTAGVDVYFSAGAFAPATAGGRELLAHEIAHVLQQTGRAASGGRLGAASRQGDGAVQRAPDTYDDEQVSFLASGKDALTSLAARHAAREDADEALTGLIDLVKRESGGDLMRKASSAIGTRLIAIANDAKFTQTVAGKDVTVPLTSVASGFLVDCLKVCGLEEHFAAAVTLLDADRKHEMRAAFGPRKDFRDYVLREQGEDWVAVGLDHPSLKPLWPSVFLNTFEQYVFNPGRPRQALYNFAETRKAELGNIDGADETLMVNDRVAMAFALLEQYDALRLRLFEILDGVFKKENIKADKPSQRLAAASAMTAPLLAMQDGAESKTWRAMLGRMAGISRDAAAFWGDIKDLRGKADEVLLKMGLAQVTTLAAGLDRVFKADDATFSPLHDLLNSLTGKDGLYGLDASGRLTTVPAAADYEKRMRTLADALGVRGNPKGNVLLALQAALVSAYDKDPEALKTDRVRAIGLAIWWLLDFKPVLTDYSASKDADARKGFTDTRLFHRLQVAVQVSRFAQIAGWTDTFMAAGRIISGDDVTTSYLITHGAWQVLYDVTPDQMAKDLGDEVIVGVYAFTPDNIARFFHANTLRLMSDAILAHVDAVRAKKAKLSVVEINRVIREAGRPWKCVPDDPRVILKPSQLAPVAGGTNPQRPTTLSLIDKSPKTLNELTALAKERKLGDDFSAVAPHKNLTQIHAWIFPNVVRLIQQLRGSEPFKTVSSDGGFDNLSDDQWMAAIIGRIEAGRLKKDIDETVKRYTEGEERGAEEALREFTILNRRQRHAELKARLDFYPDHRTVTGGKGRSFETPQDTVEAVHQFRREIQPEVDRLAQTSFLLLSLGAELDKAFDTVDHAIRVPPDFHQTLVDTVEFAEKELADAVANDQGVFAKSLRPLLYKEQPGPGAQDESFAALLKQKDALRAVAERMDEARSRMQEEMGFSSPDGETLKSLGWYPRFKPGPANAIEIDGDDWELVQVHRKFTYHPALDLSAASAKSSHAILKDASGAEVKASGTPLLSFLVNGEERDLLDTDDEQLKKLSRWLSNEAFRREMENLAEGLETGAMFVMDVVELVPGVGQEIMAARLAASTAVFLTSELPRIVDAVRDDPIRYVKDIGSKITSEYLTLDNFVKFVVLGSDSVKVPFADIRKPRAEVASSAKRKPHGRLGRLIAFVRRIGMRLGDALQWLQVRIRGPMRALQSAIATRPRLGWVLRKALDIAVWIRGLIPPGLMDADDRQRRKLGALQELIPGDAELPENMTLEKKEEHARGLIGGVEDQLKSAGEAFKAELQEKLAILREAHLPEEVVPLPKLVEFILDFFLSRLGAKVRIAKTLLQETAPYQELQSAIGTAIGGEIRGTALDPNKYWRELILVRIDAQFVDARNELVKAIYALTDRLADESGVSVLRLDRPADETVDTFKIERTPFPAEELEAAPRVEGELPASGRLMRLPTSAGQPLAVVVREAEEARFGHDFRHVRVHEGEETRQPLAEMNAEAATAGSHIFLRPGLTPTEGRGSQLVRHELTHVLQQAGARPLGGRHEVRPVRGRPGRGLMVDEMREAAARFMAEADARVAREPVDVDEGAEGVQPSLDDVAFSLLRDLTQLDSHEMATGAVDKKDPAVIAGVAIWSAIQTRLGQQKDADFEPFTQPVAAAIARHVERINLAPYMAPIGKLAQKPIKGARGKKPKTELEFDRFVTLLESVIYRETGIAMQIKAKAGPPIVLTEVKVTYVHLGWIPPGAPGKSPLWDTVMSTPELLDGDDSVATRLEIHSRLADLGPDPFIWKTGRRQFRFSEDFVEVFKKVRASRKKDLTKNLPLKGGAPPPDPSVKPPASKDEYLNPSGNDTIRLLVGLHGGFGQAKQKGLDRESHHTTQYLLIQFFRNDNKVKAWRPRTPYAGSLAKTGSRIDSFSAPGRAPLEFQSLDPGGAGQRGAAMPAILISADTHRRGQLHIEKESQWNGPAGDPDSDDEQGRATQGYAISAEWRRQQAAHLKTHDEAGDWATRMKQTDAAEQLHAAMLDTYQWMRERMLERLEDGLKTREYAYYRAIASRRADAVADRTTGKLSPKFDLKAPDMAAVFARAKRNNDEVMAKAGWTV